MDRHNSDMNGNKSKTANVTGPTNPCNDVKSLNKRPTSTEPKLKVDLTGPRVIRLTETVDLKKLRLIASNLERLTPILFKDTDPEKVKGEKTKIINYYNVAKAGNGTVSVEYTQPRGFGRYVARHALSLQAIKRSVRHTCAGEIYHDIDMVNAHPVLMRAYCHRNNIPCDSLDWYVDHREEVLGTLVKYFGSTRKEGKQLFISVLNGQGRKKITMLAKYDGGSKAQWPFYNSFYDEVQKIQDRVGVLEPKIMQYCKRTKGGKNLRGRTMSWLMSSLENEALLVMKRIFDSQKYGPEVLVYDGMMVPKNKIDCDMLDPLLRLCEQRFVVELGVPLKLSVKSMKEIIDLSGCENKKYVDDWDRFHTVIALKKTEQSSDDKEFLEKKKGEMTQEKLRLLSDTVPEPQDRWTRKIMNDKYVSPRIFNGKRQGLVISAGMGVGKTQALIEYLKGLRDNMPRSIVVLTPRITFAHSSLGRFARECPEIRFRLYNDKKHGDLSDPNVIVQCESLHKLQGKRKGGLVILDECESILTQMTSTETHEHHVENVRMFENLVREASKVICMDAFVSRTTLNTLSALGVSFDFYKYQRPLQKRTCIDVGDLKGLQARLIKDLRAGKKIFFVCSSATKLVGMIPVFRTLFPEKHILEYHSKKKSTKLRDVKSEWSRADLVACTSSITVGVNFDLEHFDQLYVYASASCNNLIRDIFQASYRVRNLRDNVLVYALDNRYFGQKVLPLSIYKLRAQLNDRDNAVRKLWDDNGTPSPVWLRDLFVMTLFEKAVSTRLLTSLFKYYLKACNYHHKASVISLDSPPVKTVSQFISYDQVPVLSVGQMNLLSVKRKDGDNLSFLELHSINRYFFDRLVTKKARVDRGSLLWEEFSRHGGHELFHRLKDELEVAHGRVTIPDLLNPLKISEGNVGAAQTHQILELARLLGLDHSQQYGTVVTREILLSALPYLDKNYEKLHSLFRVRDKIKWTKKNGPLALKQGVSLLNKILSVWGHSKLKAGKRKRKCINGKQEDITPYILEGTTQHDTVLSVHTALILQEPYRSDLPPWLLE